MESIKGQQRLRLEYWFVSQLEGSLSSLHVLKSITSDQRVERNQGSVTTRETWTLRGCSTSILAFSRLLERISTCIFMMC